MNIAKEVEDIIEIYNVSDDVTAVYVNTTPDTTVKTLFEFCDALGERGYYSTLKFEDGEVWVHLEKQ